MVNKFAKELHNWFIKQSFKGKDPYQLDAFASKIIPNEFLLKLIRKSLKPLHTLIPKSSFKNLDSIYHPKAIGLIIGGNALLASSMNTFFYKEKNDFLIKLLQDMRSKGYKYMAWGHPFEWGSSPRFPKNTPAVCVSSPILLGLLEYYKVSSNDKLINICVNAAEHLLRENGYTSINEHASVLHYSPLDTNFVYNSNALAGNFLFELGMLINKTEYIEFAKQIIRFVVGGQQDNGSWVYGNNSSIIDNRHSGFILESLAEVSKNWDDNKLKNCLERGIEYYDKNLMENGLPKWSPEKQYPIDIHDVAQSILTYVALDRIDEARYIAEFAINKMSNGKDEFYFKYFKNGRTNKNVFYRWGQAWMYYALAKLLYHEKNA